MKLQNKIALVTGGTTGIGFQTAKRFVAEGAKVYIVGRRQAELDRAVKEIGDQVVGVQGGISSQEDLKRVMKRIESDGHKLDIVFANAGGGEFAPLGAITEAHFDQTFNINVKGTLITVQHALPVLKDGASIILTGSAAANQGMPAFSVYAATKAALRSFARSWATDLKDRHIRVNTIAPGVVPTEGYETGLKLSKEQINGFASQMSQQIPLGRVGTTDEIARTVVFLASNESSYINGVELAIDGGMTQV